MDRKTAMLMGAAAAALATSPALAALPAGEPAVPVASSYAQLLEPIPNAVERLQIADADTNDQPARLIEAQWAHHHHHNNYNNYNNYNNHHHHHHHSRWWYQQNGYYWFGGAWVLRPRHHHHHSNYHHHSHY